MKYEAIIWDCDGVLIDSESINSSERVKQLETLGYKITQDDFLARFMGKNARKIFNEINKEENLNLNYEAAQKPYREKRDATFKEELKACEGVNEVLKFINTPMAIASGSNFNYLKSVLKITNLTSYFNNHIYSSEMVRNGKPAPDVFLYAAEKLGVEPNNCLVIEDGIHGINGAKAAGMNVIAYTGGSHMNKKLKENIHNANVNAIVNNMNELLPLIKNNLKRAI